MKIKTSELIDRALDWAVAKCEGFVWAKNAVRRNGDSYRISGEPVQWPIGAKCFVTPHSAKGLHLTKENWDGWLVSDDTEPLAPAAFYAVPHYSTDWAQGGPVINEMLKGGLQLQTHSVQLGLSHQAVQACYPFGVEAETPVFYGPDALIAAMRCYVASKLGDVVEVPEGLV